MQLEDLFLSVIDELRTINESWRPCQYDAEYKLLRLSGLLRQMLTDNTWLFNQINRKPEFRTRITFKVNKHRDLGSGVEFSRLSWLDPYNSPLGKNIELVPEDIDELVLDDFLGLPVIRLNGSEFTVLDLINYHANLDGAVHRSEELRPIDSRFQPFRDSEQSGHRFDGCPLPMSMLRIITAIVLNSLEPWETAIRTEREESWRQMEEDLLTKGHI